MVVKKKSKLKKKPLIIIVSLIVIVVILGGVFMYLKHQKDQMVVLAKLYFEDLNSNQEVGKTVSDIKYNLNCSHVIRYPEIGNDEIDEDIKNNIADLEDKFVSEYGDNNVANDIDGISYYQYIDYETYLAPDNTMSLILKEVQEVKDENVISEVNYIYNYSLETGEELKNSYVFVGDYKTKISSYLESFLSTNKKYKDNLNDDYKEVLKKANFKYAVTNNGLNIYFDKYEICTGSKGLIKITIPYDKLNGIMNINVSNKTKKLKANTGVNSEEVIYSVSNKTMYVKSLVNLYKRADKNSYLLSSINKGEAVKVLETSNTGWSKVKYASHTGFVSSSFLDTKVVAVEGFDEVDETVYAISEVNVRKQADANSEKLGSLKVGDEIKRIGKSSNGWSEVIYNDSSAYINSSYLSTQKINVATPVKVNPQRGIDPNKPMVALSFDDGPNPISTPRILATLAKYNAVATFFDLGDLMQSHPNVVRQEEAGGNEVGSHTYDHANLNRLSVSQIQDEMAKSEAAFMSVLGHKPTIVRPPYGSANDQVKATIQYPLINWDIDTLDWKSRNKDKILEEFRCTDNYDGKIILMHSIYGTTADAVEVIVPELISKGYQLVTISEMASYKGVNLQAGKLYCSF